MLAEFESGTLAQYLELVKAGDIKNQQLNAAGVLDHALHASSIGMLESGFREYLFFTNPEDEYQVWGLYPAKQKIADFASAYSKTSKNQPILMLVAPTGGGKTSFANRLMLGLQRHTQDGIGLYTISGCPVQESPLNLIPAKERAFYKQEYGMHLPLYEQPCPHCQAMVRKDHKGNFHQVPIERLEFSLAQGIGLGRLEPRQTQGLGKEAQENVNQIIMGANRGILEIPEFCRHDPNFIHSLNDLFRGRILQVGRQRFKFDMIILAHTTTAEFEKLTQDKQRATRPLLERMFIVYIPYNKSISLEKGMYEAELELIRSAREIHFSPGVYSRSAEAAIRTRLKPTKVSINDKLLLYDGKNTPNYSQKDLPEIEKEAADLGEGLVGISPPSMIGELTALASSVDNCLTPLRFFRSLEQTTIQRPSFEIPDRNEWLNQMRETKKNYETELIDIVIRAFQDKYEAQVQTTYELYINHAEKAQDSNRAPNVDPITRIDRNAPDLDFLKRIEDFCSERPMSNETRQSFRNKILMHPDWKSTRVLLDTFPELAAGIRKMVTGSTEEPLDILKTINPNQEQADRIQEARQRLIEAYGFCPHCAEEALNHVRSSISGGVRPPLSRPSTLSAILATAASQKRA